MFHGVVFLFALSLDEDFRDDRESALSQDGVVSVGAQYVLRCQRRPEPVLVVILIAIEGWMRAVQWPGSDCNRPLY